MSEAHRAEIAKLEALYSERPEGRVFTHLAEAYRKAGEPERALEILNEGLERHDTYASAHVVLARTLQDMDRADDAMSAFERVLELDAQNLVALKGLADLASDRGDTERAVEYYGRVAELDPSDEDVLAALESLRREGTAVRAESEETEAGGVGSMEGWDTDIAEAAGEPIEEEPSPADAGEEGVLDASLELGELPAGGAAWASAEAGSGAFAGPDVSPDDEAVADAGETGSGAEEEDDDGAVVTETMADVYARQGLYAQAVQVYERLLRQHPGEERLQAKLDDVRAALAAEEEAPADDAADDEAAGDPAAAGGGEPDAEPVTADPGVEAGWDDPVQEPEGFEAAVFEPPEAEGLEGVGSEAPEADETVGPDAEAPADAGMDVEAWESAAEPVEGLETGEFEPVDPSAEPPGAQLEDLETIEPDAAAPEPDAIHTAEPEEPVGPLEGFEAGTFEPPEEEPPGEPIAEVPEPEAETVEAAWTGAGGAVGDEASPYAWAEEPEAGAEAEAEAEEEGDRPVIRSYLDELVGWRSSHTPGAPSAEEAAASQEAAPSTGEAASSEEVAAASPEEATASPEEAAPSPAWEGPEDPEGPDDEDLDMFRSWLDNLKH